ALCSTLRPRDCCLPPCVSFLTDPPPPATYTLSLHDALPIWPAGRRHRGRRRGRGTPCPRGHRAFGRQGDACRRHGQHGLCRRGRSEEHTSELQSRENLVCRLLLEKKKTGIALARYRIIPRLG